MLPLAPLSPSPFHRDGWSYEEKVDRWRIVAVKDGRRAQLVSRTGKDHAARFHDVAQAVAQLRPRTAVIDGEPAVFDEQLVSRFHFLTDAAGQDRRASLNRAPSTGGDPARSAHRSLPRLLRV